MQTPNGLAPDQQPQKWGNMQQQYSGLMQPIRTLWVGDLQYWMDENYLYGCFAHTGEVISVKIIRNKQTGYSEGYGFVEFVSHAAAEGILSTYNGMQMPQTEQAFHMNWASSGTNERRPEVSPENSIFVGDLAPDVTDYVLQETFQSRYPSVKGAKVVIDVTTGRSKGYGFVRFGDENERLQAMTEMNGVYCSTRPMRISAATPKKALNAASQMNNKGAYQSQTYAAPAASQSVPIENDSNNTTIFVGCLDPNVTDEELRQIFGHFGDLVYVKIPVGKGCGFVQFTHRSCAEEALRNLHGTVIGQQSIRLSWGRSPANKQRPALYGWGQFNSDPNQWGGYYGYGQSYEGYEYPQDPAAYAYAYGNYLGYENYTPQGDDQSAGVQSNANSTQVTEHKEEEALDPLAPPDIDKLNAAYIAVHQASLLGRHLWLKTSQQVPAA
eukprot:Gb_24595 [translate_table: standard]